MTALTKDAIVALLERNDTAVARALLVLNGNQTLDEQAAQDVKHRNGMGFRPSHARMGTSMAQQYAARGRLSEKQIAYWRARDVKGNMRIGIYWRQLIEAAKAKTVAPAAPVVPAEEVYVPAIIPRETPVNEIAVALEEALMDLQICMYNPELTFGEREHLQEQIAAVEKQLGALV